jgi:hypothetical protein
MNAGGSRLADLTRLAEPRNHVVEATTSDCASRR